MFGKAREYIRRRMLALSAQRGGHVPNSGRTEWVGYGDHTAEFAKGEVVVTKRRVYADGTKGPWLTVYYDPNLVVTQAERLMAQMAIGTANSALNYIELGDPSPTATPPQLTDLTLEQTTGQRKLVALTASGNVVTAEATWTTAEGNGFTYTEAGLFTGPFAAGSMFARKTFTGITKTNAFELRFTWLITFLVQTQGGDCAGVALTGPSTIASFTEYLAVGGETSVAATFDFVPNSNLVDVFLNGQRLVPGKHYNEANAPLSVPQGGGGPASKGVNLTFVLLPADEVLLVHRAIQ